MLLVLLGLRTGHVDFCSGNDHTKYRNSIKFNSLLTYLTVYDDAR